MKTESQGKLAVVYARYSSHSQGEQSIEGQLAAAKKYAEVKGYTIVHEYIDRAISGRTDNRDAFQQMLSDCAKKQFSVIIVWKVDRFGRNREEITFNKYRAKKHDVRVEYVAENLPDSPEGVILESVLEGMAEYYSLQLAQNIRRGISESAKKRHVIGLPPLGYRKAKDYTYEIDPETAPIVQLIFEKYASGSTMAEIIKYLNEQGYRTTKGKPFTKNSLPRILSSEKYIGVYTYKDQVRDESAIPPLIDKETFATVQEMLKINRRMPSHRWNYTDFLLTGKLFCGHCGSLMFGESGTGKMGVKYNYYTCQQHRKNPAACRKKSVRYDLIEPLVLDEIQSILRDDALLEFIAENTWQYYLSQDTEQEQIRVMQKQLSDVDTGISNLVRSIEAGLFNSAIKARMDELEAQKVAITKALADKELERGFKLTKDHILYFLGRMKDMDIRDRECQRRLVETFVNAIFVYDDHLAMTFNYGGDSRTITLSEITDAEAGAGFVCRAQCSISKRAEKWLKYVISRLFLYPVFSRGNQGGNQNTKVICFSFLYCVLSTLQQFLRITI